MKPVILNLGCGFKKWPGAVNVDNSTACNPDMVMDLDSIPWPMRDETADEVYASHVFEHLENWWGAFEECARVLKPGGRLEVRVPDISSDSALGFRDHRQIITANSFYGVGGWYPVTDAGASEISLPLKMVSYHRVPHRRYKWIPGWALRWAADHLRNFIDEARFVFIKTG